MKQATFVIIGGGIAGVSCAEGISFLAPEESIILISSSPTIKKVSNLKHLTKLLSEFTVEEKSSESLVQGCSSLTIIHSAVNSIDYKNKLVFTSNETVKYEKLCICSGASPKLIDSNPLVIGIRDTDSVQEFQKRLVSSKKMLVIGNGGIATELVHEVEGMEIIWVIKNNHISATFIDPGAAEFFQSSLIKEDKNTDLPTKRLKFTVEEGSPKGGAALGPDWHSQVDLRGMLQSKSSVTIEYSSEVEKILNKSEGMKLTNEDWPIFVKLTNGKVYGCDFIVSATGVVPNTSFLTDTGIHLSPDGGITVDWKMETSLADVYAAGDVCTTSWEAASQWFQMRLWTQAHQMGLYAAKAMVTNLKGEELLQDFCFELFTHVTKFFGFKVILLGLFNGQRLENNYEILLRVTKGLEYIKLILKDGRMQGAVLIGETDLEEMCENLILNQLDLSPFGEDLLDPNIDIEDYFD
ncbi:pyridine nucleotide-disulfide oxidoreductase domain-containing protein 1 [Halyomorpha halys]|uniref:pyridine nucleotide-disulfide oxidoreductase domain-containing protein 1 n=1 Tax=Halyomorpha halys TaxID=286706 RepID=UPI0006D4DCD6|nr:pyridine nucleotide-disulfide oxidoreductase domain-containing protein 1 [Halyomorpha halys]